MACEVGNVNFTLPEEKEVIQDRDVNDHVRLGPDGVSRITFSMIAETIADGNAASGAISVFEALTFTGGAAAWVKEASVASSRLSTSITARSGPETRIAQSRTPLTACTNIELSPLYLAEPRIIVQVGQKQEQPFDLDAGTSC